MLWSHLGAFDNFSPGLSYQRIRLGISLPFCQRQPNLLSLRTQRVSSSLSLIAATLLWLCPHVQPGMKLSMCSQQTHTHTHTHTLQTPHVPRHTQINADRNYFYFSWHPHEQTQHSQKHEQRWLNPLLPSGWSGLKAAIGIYTHAVGISCSWDPHPAQCPSPGPWSPPVAGTQASYPTWDPAHLAAH